MSRRTVARARRTVRRGVKIANTHIDVVSASALCDALARAMRRVFALATSREVRGVTADSLRCASRAETSKGTEIRTRAVTSSARASSGRRGGADANAREANATGAKYLGAMVVAVVGATYASVPLYRMFCQATGFGGTTRRATLEEKLESEAWSKEARDEASKREIKIYFNADVAEGMPWRFRPTQKSVTVRPGESALAFYTAKNNSSTPVTGVATYNVQPNKVGQYFNKVQCFCFEEQRLRGKEEVDMPVLFYVDPEFARDPAMRDVRSLVLSYTFFKSDDFDEDEDEGYVRTSGVRVHAPSAPITTASAQSRRRDDSR